MLYIQNLIAKNRRCCLRNKSKKTKRDMAKHIDVDVSTLYNWRRFKPELFRIVMLGFKFDELISVSKAHYHGLCELDTVIKDEIERYKLPKKRGISTPPPPPRY